MWQLDFLLYYKPYGDLEADSVWVYTPVGSKKTNEG